MPDSAKELGVTSRGASGVSYIRISGSGMSDPEQLTLTLIHEFFHALQSPYLAIAGYRDLRQQGGVTEEHWFTEASATWAEMHFSRLAPLGAEAARRRLHEVRFDGFRTRTATLTKPYVYGDSQEAYDAYIWPLFVELETGSAQFMRPSGPSIRAS